MCDCLKVNAVAVDFSTHLHSTFLYINCDLPISVCFYNTETSLTEAHSEQCLSLKSRSDRNWMNNAFLSDTEELKRGKKNVILVCYPDFVGVTKRNLRQCKVRANKRSIAASMAGWCEMHLWRRQQRSMSILTSPLCRWWQNKNLADVLFVSKLTASFHAAW